MVRWLERQPFQVILIGMGALAMMLPAAHARVLGDYHVSRTFFYGGMLSALLALFLGIAMAGRPRQHHPRRHLMAMLGLFVLYPLLLAVPFQEAVRNTTFLNAYVEMVSALTTTGATLFDDPGRLAPSVHLWRATVGWLGGLFMWVGAIAVLAPMALGGFEVRARRSGFEQVGAGFSQIDKVADMSYRLRTYGAQLLPVYVGLTALMWIGLILVGENPFTAVIHAMSTLSTSGISPVNGLRGDEAGYGGEVVMATFMIFALSRLTFAPEGQKLALSAYTRDPEIRLAASIVAIVPLVLFVRHFIGAFEVDREMSLLGGLGTLWGSLFTTLSFLTTTGFVSDAWGMSQAWSGLSSSGLILLGLALVGGGVATTAGGAKLLRVYALYKHGKREIERLVHPHSIGGSGGEARHLRRRGAYMAWVFFMLMTVSVAMVMVAFSFTGESFEQSLVLTIASLTTTGPLAAVAGSEPISYGALSTAAKLVLTGAMVLGRLETLAIVALFSPDLWRGR